MGSPRFAIAAILMLTYGAILPAWACGDSEAPSSCSTNENEAKWMLKRVVQAIDANKAEALHTFRLGTAGFRTVDTYVFCVDLNGMMTAHPSPLLQDQNVRDLHDETGNYFIAKMLQTAKPGEISEIRYLFPRPGGTIPTAKTTYYTRAGDQVCGVGIYDKDPEPTKGPEPTSETTLNTHLMQLQQRLTAEMPANLQPDWTAFQQALTDLNQARNAAFDQVRQHVDAADALFAPGGPLATHP